MYNVKKTFLPFINVTFYRATLYASAVYAVTVCPSVRLYVCLSQAGIVPKHQNAGSRKERHTIAHVL